MNRKRGMLLVVLLVLLLVVFGGSGFGLEEAPKIAEVRFGFDDCCNWPYDCDGGKVTADIRVTIGESSCDIPPEEGCSERLDEYCADNDHDCVGVKEGAMLHQYFVRWDWESVFIGSYGCGWACIGGKDIKSGDNNAYLCSDGGWWKQCGPEDQGKVTWVNSVLYNCTIDEEKEDLPMWKELPGVDVDHDGYTPSMGDCADRPDAPELTPPEQCPESPDDCEPYYKNSKCAICINPGAPEVCGDFDLYDEEIDNDCNSGTSNDCHENEYACENRKETDEDGIEFGPTHTNIYDEAFDYENIDEEDYRCCGYTGIEDLGRKGTGTAEDNYICLNNNEDLVGVAGGDVEAISWGPENDPCEEWCWISASMGDAPFNIYTIRKPGDPAYDVVSNSMNWFVCNNSEKILKQPFLEGAGEGEISYMEIANRFYCYPEGDHWSWAECYGKNADQKNGGTIKGRYEGEGLYTLFLKNADVDGVEVDNRIQLNTIQGKYKDFYGESFFDFSGYNYLNFMVKFCEGEEGGCKDIGQDELKDILPVDVFLKIYGPEQGEDEERALYFNRNVLGYVVNNPFFSKDNWMHVRVPIKNFKGIELIEIKSEPSAIDIKVRNVYLSKEETETQETRLCSGQDTSETGESSWLTNIDQGDPRKEISGKDLCNALYDPEGGNAWLGNDKEIDSDKDWANCCGNDENEYYSGKSKPVGEEEKNYGCWNSQVIGSKDTTMNVEFEVEYKEEAREINYDQAVPFGYDVIAYYNLDASFIEAWEDRLIDVEEKERLMEFSGSVSFEDDYKVEANRIGILPFIYEIGYGTPRKSYKLTKLKLEYEAPEVEVYFLNKFTGENLDEIVNEENLWYGLDNIAIIAETDVVKPGRVTKTDEGPENLTYTCNKAECLYPLPGIPEKGIKITNPYPDLYELWFVSEGEDDVLIDSTETFYVPGNLKAKKVAQQVIFINEEDEETGEVEQGFFGCQAAKFIEDLEVEGEKIVENLNYCEIKGDKFCAYSVVHEADKEKYTTINSWSNEDLTMIGYQEIAEGGEIPEEFELMTGETEPATKRNYSSVVVPGRNFVPNAEFNLRAKELPHWEIIQGGTLVEDEKDFVGENKTTITLKGTEEILKSERIAVEKKLSLSFSQDKTCNLKIYLVDKDGKKEEAGDNSAFNTGDTPKYLILEFEGPGKIEKPMLQIIDDLGAADYSYNEETERAGTACCLENWCWNGYACIKEMSELTYMREKVGEERFYRCIQGEWKHLPVQWDWNFEKFGFCSTEDQCFVISSLAGGDPEAGTEDFYQGRFPTCINNSEFIFDHYCEKGSWTSRTKFLASNLLEAYGNDEFILYCTSHRDALLDYGEKEAYLGGTDPTTPTPEAGLGETIGGEVEEESIMTCFPNLLGGEGERLVPEPENTCINNVCVLRFKEGGKFKSAFATTLNKEIDDSNSFLIALNIPHDKLNEICQGAEGFIECDLSDLELKGDLWYSSKINGVVYGKEGVSVSRGVLDKIRDWFSGLFGIEEESGFSSFVKEAANFKELYLLNKDGKRVRAMQEIFPGNKTLVAEYENFETPICDYVNNIEIPPEVGMEPLEAAAGMRKMNCSKEDSKQKVMVIAGLDFFWPQLTGKLRVE